MTINMKNYWKIYSFYQRLIAHLKRNNVFYTFLIIWFRKGQDPKKIALASKRRETFRASSTAACHFATAIININLLDGTTITELSIFCLKTGEFTSCSRLKILRGRASLREKDVFAHHGSIISTIIWRATRVKIIFSSRGKRKAKGSWK